MHDKVDSSNENKKYKEPHLEETMLLDTIRAIRQDKKDRSRKKNN